MQFPNINAIIYYSTTFQQIDKKTARNGIYAVANINKKRSKIEKEKMKIKFTSCGFLLLCLPIDALQYTHLTVEIEFYFQFTALCCIVSLKSIHQKCEGGFDFYLQIDRVENVLKQRFCFVLKMLMEEISSFNFTRVINLFLSFFIARLHSKRRKAGM